MLINIKSYCNFRVIEFSSRLNATFEPQSFHCRLESKGNVKSIWVVLEDCSSFTFTFYGIRPGGIRTLALLRRELIGRLCRQLSLLCRFESQSMIRQLSFVLKRVKSKFRKTVNSYFLFTCHKKNYFFLIKRSETKKLSFVS